MSEYVDIEKPCADIAEAAGWMTRKLDVGPGGKGWPDRLFMGPNNEHFIVEFKRPGEPLKIKQMRKIGRLRALKHTVYVCDSVPHFEVIFEHHKHVAARQQ